MNVPHLTANMSFDDAIPVLNGSFEELASDISHISPIVDTQSSPFNISVAPNTTVYADFTLYSETKAVSGAIIKYSVFVDHPAINFNDPSRYDPSYIYPDGSNCTGGRRAFWYNCLLVDPARALVPLQNQDTSWVDDNGKTYYFFSYCQLQVINLDSATHTYFFLPEMAFVGNSTLITR